MPVPIHHLQRADRLLGRWALLALWPAAVLRRAPAAERRVLVIKFWGLGSLQLMTPALEALGRAHPGARLELLTLPTNRAFVERLGLFEAIHTVDVTDAGWARTIWRLARTARAIRARRFAAVYDFEFFTNASAAFAVLSGAPESHGFAAPGSRRTERLHTHRVPFNRYRHVARNFRSLAGGADDAPVRAGDLSPFEVRDADRAELASLAFEHGFAGEGPLVVLNPNAGGLSLERRWPAERFGLLAARCIGELGARVALIGAPDERARNAEVVRHAGPQPAGRIFDLAGRASLPASFALLASADVFVTNDSGPMHVAAALGTPTLGLFGPETPVMYAPLGMRARWFYEPPPCSPCINVHDNKLSVCVKGFAECLTNISVARVFAAVREELATPRSEPLEPERAR
ncbi:MAG: glycosyltransferase family 9 protein [Planctomycetota bacterium]